MGENLGLCGEKPAHCGDVLGKWQVDSKIGRTQANSGDVALMLAIPKEASRRVVKVAGVFLFFAVDWGALWRDAGITQDVK